MNREWVDKSAMNGNQNVSAIETFDEVNFIICKLLNDNQTGCWGC